MYKIKIDSNFKTKIICILILITSMMLTTPLILIFSGLIILFFLQKKINSKNVAIPKWEKRMHKIAVALFTIDFVFFVSQVIFLSLDKIKAIKSFSIMACIFIGFIMISIDYRSFVRIDAYVSALNIFVSGFSLYYIIKVLFNGLPENRDSVLGIVSSNYCAAILMLAYPLFLYYLLGRNGKSNLKISRQSIYSIALSMIVIILSGSRTAFGIVVLMGISIGFLRQNRINDKLKYIFLFIVMSFLVSLCYVQFPEVKQLIDRAITGLQGQQVVREDVRVIMWAQAFDLFKSGNILIGSGSNIVPLFARPAHNLFFEVILWGGYLGCGLALLSNIIFFALTILYERYYQRFFSIMLLLIFLVIAYVQPFFSTGFTCGIILWISIMVILSDDSSNELLEVK